MPADSANWGIGEATAVYQSGGAFGTWNYQDFIKGFFEDPATQAKIAGKNVHLHTPAGSQRRDRPLVRRWSFGMSKDSKKKEAAWTFIQWITSKEIQEARHGIWRRPVAPFHVQERDAGQASALVAACL